MIKWQWLEVGDQMAVGDQGVWLEAVGVQGVPQLMKIISNSRNYDYMK